METREMTKEQLIAQIDALNEQVVGLKKTETPDKKVEADLQASDNRSQFPFNTVPIGLIITNAQGDIINSNKTMQDLLEYTPEALKTMNIVDLYAQPGERQRLLDILYEKNRVCDFETIIKHRDGTLRTVLINSDYIELDNEKVLLTSVHDITLYKQIQDDLQESEKGYHVLFSNAPVGITVTDFQGGVTASNQAIQELLGYNTEEFKNKNAHDFYYDAAERQRLLDLTEKIGIVRDFETRFRHKNGSVITVLINTDLIDFKDQHKVMLTSIRDITNLKQVEEELTKERDFTNAIFNITASLMMVLDRNGKITRFNRACEEITGYSFQEMKGKHIWDTLSVNPEITRERVEKLLAGNYPISHESVWLAKNGAQRLISWTDTVLLDNEGKVEYIIATGIDITEKRQAEIEYQKASQKSEKKYKNLYYEFRNKQKLLKSFFDTIPDLIFYKNVNSDLLGCNKAYEKFVGIKEENLVGTTGFDFFPEDTAKMFREKDIETMAKSCLVKNEEILTDFNGESSLFETLKAPYYDTEGNIAGLIGISRDITEKKQAEIELQKANQKLAGWNSELEERTAQMNLLSDMGDQLQSCQSIEEACAISSQYIQLLFPASNGAIYMINPSKDLAEAVEMWDDAASTEKVFLPLNCWAVRRNRTHLVDKAHPGLHCGHITGPKDGQYLCVPMMAQGETIGILHLNHIAPYQDQQESTHLKFNEHETQVVMELAEHIALALSNLKLRDALRQQSIRDLLTGLFNRRYMEETLTRELHRAEREKRPVGMIMFDIDHFKEFNDLSGHDGGDALLRELGVFLKKNVRGTDIVCRYGGEEFVAVLPGATLEETRLRAEELRQGVKELLVYYLGKTLGKCTISLGVAAFPEHGLASEELLKNADNSLYRAKNEGRDRVVVTSVIS